VGGDQARNDEAQDSAQGSHAIRSPEIHRSPPGTAGDIADAAAKNSLVWRGQ